MKYFYRPLMIFICIEIPIVFLILGCTIFGNVNMGLKGFAVDSEGLLYLGMDSKIRVFKDGVLSREISAKTSNGYAFTLNKDDTISLCALNKVYILDLQGNEICTEDDKTTRIFNQIYNERKQFRANDGTVYSMKNPLGYYYICNDSTGEIIYKMPISHYIIKLLFFGVIISFFICIPIIVIKWRKSMYNGRIFPLTKDF